MDTDKKRKTIRCQKCGLTFSGERVYCPLCKKRIIDEGTEDSSIKEDFDVFPVTQKKQAGKGFFWTSLPACGNWLIYSQFSSCILFVAADYYTCQSK